MIKRQVNANNFNITNDEKKLLEEVLEKLSPYRMSRTTKLSAKQKEKLIDTANYCFVCQSQTIKIFLRELEQLLKRGGMYFEIWDKVPVSQKERDKYEDPDYA